LTKKSTRATPMLSPADAVIVMLVFLATVEPPAGLSMETVGGALSAGNPILLTEPLPRAKYYRKPSSETFRSTRNEMPVAKSVTVLPIDGSSFLIQPAHKSAKK